MRDPDLRLALATLERTPLQLEDVARLVPSNRWTWEPSDWEGFPGERFSAVGQLCHLRDIETDGYHVRIRRMLDEAEPDLVSLDGYELARERRYPEQDPGRALAAFHDARRKTLTILAGADATQLERRGTFAEHGAITLRALIHYLCSHDQQHLSCLHWLLGRIDSSRRP
jgi:hypothetical protein